MNYKTAWLACCVEIMITGQQMQNIATAVNVGPWVSQFGCLQPSSPWDPSHTAVCCDHWIYKVLHLYTKTQTGCALIGHWNRPQRRAKPHTCLQKKDLKEMANPAGYLLVSVLRGIDVILQELGLNLQLQVAQQRFVRFLQGRDTSQYPRLQCHKPTVGIVPLGQQPEQGWEAYWDSRRAMKPTSRHFIHHVLPLHTLLFCTNIVYNAV